MKKIWSLKILDIGKHQLQEILLLTAVKLENSFGREIYITNVYITREKRK